MASSHFSIQNMHQMLLRLTSGDFWIHVVFDTQQKKNRAIGPNGIVLRWDLDLTATAGTAGER